ncbi:MAG: hypothetical protein IPL46_03345 [Saprospiraceae bacterium]|nr:hypothetical protein [Saprospiraceae bacterium]
MKRLIISFIGLLAVANTMAQTFSSMIRDHEIYNFLNWITVNEKKYREEPKLMRKNIYSKILNWEMANFVAEDTSLINKNPNFSLDDKFLYQGQADTIFKLEDKNFLYSQFLAIKDTVWHHKFLASKLIIDEEYKKLNRYHYSIPLFSADKNLVIVHRQYFCGNLCAYGGYFVYRRRGYDKWELVTSVNTWIS